MVLCIADVGASTTLVLQSLNIILWLLLIHGLIDHSLCDAAHPVALLFVVVEGCVHAALLATPHVRSPTIAVLLPALNKYS